MAQQSRGRAQSATDAELCDYYMSGDSAQGLVSSFEPLVGIACGGAGGTTDPEAKLVRRHQLGPATSTAVTRFRITRETLRRLSKDDNDTLPLYYAPIDWLGVFRAHFDEGKNASRGSGKGKGDELYNKAYKRMGPLLGVALLTVRVQRGVAEERAKADARRAKIDAKTATVIVCDGRRVEALRPHIEEASSIWLSPLGWLTAACMSERANDRAASDVQEQARERWNGAVFRYIDTSRVVAAERSGGKTWEHWERGIQ